jgi:hypothetical protein
MVRSAYGGRPTEGPRAGAANRLPAYGCSPAVGALAGYARTLSRHSKAIGGKSSAIKKYSKRYWITRIWLWRRWSLSSRCNAE